MANALYGPGREGFLKGEIDWDTARIKVAMVSGYTRSGTHKFVQDVLDAGGTIVAQAELTPKTAVNGVADAGDVTFTEVPAGDPITHLIVFQSSAVTGGADVGAGSQRLIASFDTSSGVPLPITPNGGDITIQWDNGSYKIFSL